MSSSSPLRMRVSRHLSVSASPTQLYRSFPDSESLFPGMRAHPDGLFISDIAQGDNLRFDPRGRHDWTTT